MILFWVSALLSCSARRLCTMYLRRPLSPSLSLSLGRWLWLRREH